MKIKTFLTLTIAAIIITSCSTTKLQNYPAEACKKLPGEKTLSVIKDKCSLCHKGDFATKEMICAKKSMIIDSVTAKRMPKFGSLTEEQFNTILKWEL